MTDRQHPQHPQSAADSVALDAPAASPPGSEAKPYDNQIDKLCIDTIRTLSMDAVQKAESTAIRGRRWRWPRSAYTLWQSVPALRSRKRRIWPNRDRFVLSNGHASMLLYSLIHLVRHPRQRRSRRGPALSDR